MKKKYYRLIINCLIIVLTLVLTFSFVTVKASAPYTTRTVNRYGEVIETHHFGNITK